MRGNTSEERTKAAVWIDTQLPFLMCMTNHTSVCTCRNQIEQERAANRCSAGGIGLQSFDTLLICK
jgi:hypothetical protein